MGGGMMKKRTMMKNGGLKMVTKNGKKVPFFAAALPLGHNFVILNLSVSCHNIFCMMD